VGLQSPQLRPRPHRSGPGARSARLGVVQGRDRGSHRSGRPPWWRQQPRALDRPSQTVFTGQAASTMVRYRHPSRRYPTPLGRRRSA
jgi:hypothetical protein